MVMIGLSFLVEYCRHDYCHLNASIMALLRVPDKYAQERGGWKTDAVMKKVYAHTFSEERQNVDQTIDTYFNSLLSPEKKTHGKNIIGSENTAKKFGSGQLAKFILRIYAA